MSDVRIFSDLMKLSRAAADFFVTLNQQASAEQRRFTVALSGGSTPESFYALVGSDNYAHRIQWEQVHLFWGDERCVAPTHPDSNYLLAQNAFINHVPIPAANVHRIKGELPPDVAARDYETELRNFFGDGPPRFDMVLLGLGEDGHTASLFPQTAALQESARWVVPNFVPALRLWRITLTPTIINQAARVVFLVSGEQKASRLKDILHGDYQPDQYPAQLIKAQDGQLIWLVDEAAAAEL